MSCICPTCESELPTGNLLKKHHELQHGEEVSGLVKVICPSCDDERGRYRSRLPRTEGYCRDCFDDVMRKTWKGENHPNWQGGMTKKKCGFCEEAFESYESEERDYCSKCWSEHRGEIWSGEGNPLWTERDEVICSECGKDMKVPQYRSEPEYCSDCFNGKRAKIWGGENSPLYQGGTTDYFGPNWDKQRRKALKRDDNKCVVCGMDSEEHIEKYGQSIHVHHIRPRSEFIQDGEFDYEEANRVDNLISLCNSHHRSIESNLP